MTSYIIPLPFVPSNLESVERKEKITKIWISQKRKEYLQGTIYNGHKITAVIWPVGNKDLSTLDV